MNIENAAIGKYVLLRAGTFFPSHTFPCMHSFYECIGNIVAIDHEELVVQWYNGIAKTFHHKLLIGLAPSEVPLYFVLPLKLAVSVLYDYAMINADIRLALLNDIEANSINLVRATINNYCSLAEVYQSDEDDAFVKLIIRQPKSCKQGCKNIW